MSKRQPIPDTILQLPSPSRRAIHHQRPQDPEPVLRSFTLTIPEEAYLTLLGRAQEQSVKTRKRVGVVAVARELLLKGLEA